jgi:hypothetical protein
MPLTKEIKRAARQAYIDEQTKLIASELNRYYTGEKVNHDPDINECGIHFAEFGGADAFFEEFRHLRDLKEEDINALSQKELKMLRRVYTCKLKEAITSKENMYYAGLACGHQPSFKEAKLHFLNNGCVKKFKEEYGWMLHPQKIIEEQISP